MFKIYRNKSSSQNEIEDITQIANKKKLILDQVKVLNCGPQEMTNRPKVLKSSPNKKPSNFSKQINSNNVITLNFKFNVRSGRTINNPSLNELGRIVDDSLSDIQNDDDDKIILNKIKRTSVKKTLIGNIRVKLASPTDMSIKKYLNDKINDDLVENIAEKKYLRRAKFSDSLDKIKKKLSNEEIKVENNIPPPTKKQLIYYPIFFTEEFFGGQKVYSPKKTTARTNGFLNSTRSNKNTIIEKNMNDTKEKNNNNKQKVFNTIEIKRNEKNRREIKPMKILDSNLGKIGGYRHQNTENFRSNINKNNYLQNNRTIKV